MPLSLYYTFLEEIDLDDYAEYEYLILHIAELLEKLFPNARVWRDFEMDYHCGDAEAFHLKIIYKKYIETVHVCLTDFPVLAIFTERICEKCKCVQFYDDVIHDFMGCACDDEE